MAKDTTSDLSLNDLSDAEIERIEATIFCMGGPPSFISAMVLERAAVARAAVARPAVALPVPSGRR